MDDKLVEITLFGDFYFSYTSPLDMVDLQVIGSQNSTMTISMKGNDAPTPPKEEVKPLPTVHNEEKEGEIVIHKGRFPESTTNILKQWLLDHKKHPYPTQDEKERLSEKTGLTRHQIDNWFINARKRILKKV